MAAALLMLALAFGASKASAQCPDYWVNYNYVIPPVAAFSLNVEANFQFFTHRTTEGHDGHYTYRQDPAWGRPLGATVCGTFVPIGAIALVTCGVPPNDYCLKVEVRLNPCLEIKIHYEHPGPC